MARAVSVCGVIDFVCYTFWRYAVVHCRRRRFRAVGRESGSMGEQARMTNDDSGAEKRDGSGQAGMPGDAERLARHYAGAGGIKGANRETLLDGLRRAFVASGRNPDRLTLDDIAGIDQLHLGGRRASRALARLGEFSPGVRVLDVGCGTGGASRLLAAEHGVEVVGIDITAPFVEVARWLSRPRGWRRTHVLLCRCRLVPLPDACVDVVWCQHALMNMPDTEAVLKEWRRLLVPGGRVLLHEVVAGENPAELMLPVLARERSTSHLQTPRMLERRLATAGFRPLEVADVTAEALAWRRSTIVRRHAARHRPYCPGQSSSSVTASMRWGATCSPTWPMTGCASSRAPGAGRETNGRDVSAGCPIPQAKGSASSMVSVASALIWPCREGKDESARLPARNAPRTRCR